MKHELKPGKALVITGPQGCGKTTLASQLAKQRGSFIETDALQLETRRGLSDLMESEPSTVICDGMPDGEYAKARLKALITSDTVMVFRKHGAPKKVKTPNFIFCTGSADPLFLIAADQRFHVIELGA